MEDSRDAWNPCRIALLAFLVRCVAAAVSSGTNDIRTWELFGSFAAQHGVSALYQNFTLSQTNFALFNHPPLMGVLAGAIYKISSLLKIPFSIAFKFPEIVADTCSVLVVGTFIEKRGGSVTVQNAGTRIYACALPAILISGFHGNTDPLCALFLLLSALNLQRNCHLRAGLLLGLALNVKVLALIALPALFATAPTWRARTRFSVGLVALVIPLMYALAVTPHGLENVFGYKSFVALWGVRIVALIINPETWNSPSMGIFRFIMGASLLLDAALRVWRKNSDPAQALFSAWAIFLILSPGFGLQYLIYPIAPLIVIDPAIGVWFSFAVGLYLLDVYFHFLLPGLPLTTFHNNPITFPDAVALAALVWLMLGSALVRTWPTKSPYPSSART